MQYEDRQLPDYQSYDELAERIDRTRRRWRAADIWHQRAAFIAIVAGMMLAFAATEALFHPPSSVRWAMFGVFVAAAAAGTALLLIRPMLHRRSDEEVAIHVERCFPQIRNGLINSVQLSQDPMVTAPAIVDRLIRNVADGTRELRFVSAIDLRPLKRFAAAAVLIVLAVVGLTAAWPDNARNAIARVLMPWKYIPAMGAARIVSVDAPASVFAGENLHIIVTADNIPDEAVDAVILHKWADPEETVAKLDERIKERTSAGDLPANADAMREHVRRNVELRQVMAPVGDAQFAGIIREVWFPLVFRIRINDTETLYHRVDVATRPAVQGVDVAYTFPEYTGLASAEEKSTNGALRAIKGTDAALTVTANKPIARAGLLLNGKTKRKLLIDPESLKMSARLRITRNGSYTINLVDEDGNANRDPIQRLIRCIQDRPPSIRFSAPAQDVSIPLGGTVSFILQMEMKAHDDFGISTISLLAQRNQDGTVAAFKRMHTWKTFLDPKNVAQTYSWRFSPADYTTGDRIVYYAEAIDNNDVSGAGKASTARFVVQIEDKGKVIADLDRKFDDWMKQLAQILKAQQEARAGAKHLHGLPLGRLKAAAARIEQKQIGIRRDTIIVANAIEPLDARIVRVRDVLHGLTAHEMADAIRHASDLTRAVTNKLPELEQTQDKIIAVLQEIIDLLPRLAEAAKEEEDEDDAGDLPEDVQDKLKDLADALKDFIDEQKKVIETTEDLAKKPVDDFTDEDDKLVEELAAIEDKWSRFLKEAHSDLSKLPEQDFSNPSLLKELIEIQSEVEMAEGALSKKVMEIATPLEENGVELAQSLATHLEKWLPDTPDRDRWQMEEPLGDYETPMAELPDELEDIVGELMEEQEDIFDEMEDATSGWADSLDKGAGWDTMDGPISNMSAQGVTGNRLPNQSEIGGRSGEGRSGKSSGEFVEETATGKGGRDTPTRLTPEAFSKGQIKDTSKDPTGGATGGGKVSGAGSEGMEGPVPRELALKLKNMARKQSFLRNSAEKISAQFEIANYPSLFKETITEMKAVEDDLSNLRYRNALRRRGVLLKNLKETRMFLGGQVGIRRDRSNPLPSRMQDEITDAIGGASPKGYEELLKDYFRALQATDLRLQAPGRK